MEMEATMKARLGLFAAIASTSLSMSTYAQGDAEEQKTRTKYIIGRDYR